MVDTKQVQLIIRAQSGDEQAFEQIFMQFEGLVWKMYSQQRVRPQPNDWQQECRVVLHKTLRLLRNQTWAALTIYYQRSLQTHVVQIWRNEYRVFDVQVPILKETIAPYDAKQSIVKYEPMINEWLTTIIEWYLTLPGKERELAYLLMQGYGIAEAAKVIKRSRSWCYGVRRKWQLFYHDEIRKH
ncbi:hypothetical protein ACFQGR_06935 [Weissella sagaensis]|jgi:hypothetical protein|uniref:Helix-turn-helix domain-containing protein n=1 Tax=Weissella sagaensis TaxID=2559928 RepID=A0ABW1RVD7_9LACO|nr:hypothetical protein [Weissella sagaensis]KAA8434716.1 hypothetical protein FKV79_02455 [Weissella paramesenteroides]KAA8437675.1 hypothetical protein FKV73_06660 [Weissella paramesenteroides]QDJ59391.1 hypothetical protein EFA59_07670 [Weissella hellenica]